MISYDEEWKAAYDAFASDLADVFERHEEFLGTARGVYDDEDLLARLRRVPITGWVLAIERFDPMVDESGFNTFFQPRMQSPTHTMGLLSDALDSAR